MCGIDRGTRGRARPRRAPALPLALATLLAAWGAAPAAAAPAGVPQASGLRVEADGRRTRVVLELDRAVAFRTFAVPRPVRLVVDLPEVEWRLRSPPVRGRAAGLVTAESHGLFGPGRSRLVLDLAAPFKVVSQALVPAAKGGAAAHRLVIELEPLAPPPPARAAAAPAVPRRASPPAVVVARAAVAPVPARRAAPAPKAAAAPPPGRPPPVPMPRPAALDLAAAVAIAPPPVAPEPPGPVPAPALSPSEVREPPPPLPPPASPGPVDARKLAALVVPAPPPPAPEAVPEPGPGPDLPVIVIDPGHGGVDPGAVGVNGALEKDVVLELGRALRDLLLASGRYRAVLTREDDSFVRLRERIARAREAGADLFVSLHADSLSLAAQRGASVYTLSETATDEEAGRLASKENKSDVLAGTDLSAHDSVVTSILIDLAQRETNNRSIGFAEVLAEELAGSATLVHRRQRSAGFAVLKSPDVPSVLIEIGYLSNADDARELSRPGYRAGLADAVLRALDRQFGHPKS